MEEDMETRIAYLQDEIDEEEAKIGSKFKLPKVAHFTASSDLNESMLSEDLHTESSSDEDNEKSFREATEKMLQNMSTKYASSVVN